MSTPSSLRLLLRPSRLPLALPVRLSQRAIHSSSRKQEDNSTPSTQSTSLQRKTNRTKAVAPKSNAAATENFPAYTPEEMKILKQKYTPEQMKAIMAGEAAISAEDLYNQGVVRNDTMKVGYVDDFSQLHPVLDRKPLAPSSHEDPNLRYKTDEEMDEDLARWIEDLPEKPNRLEWHKYEENMRMMVGKEEAEKQPINYTAPTLSKLTDPLVKQSVDKDETKGAQQAEIEMLAKQTGLSKRFIERLRIRQISLDFVSNQTRGGKIRAVHVCIVAGNMNGLIGIGDGKAVEHGSATIQAKIAAIKNLKPIPRYEKRTIYGDVKGKVSGTVVELYNRPPGFGIRCQERIHEIAMCAGISDLSARLLRSSNKMNTAKATVQALLSQRTPDAVARARGRKMVDVRKVYYAGAT